MDFQENIKLLAERSAAAQKHAMTEEATKTAVIMPFLQALGFDVFNLNEVVPEFTSDIGTKKGERVDYAVKINGKIAMLIEAKPINTALNEAQFNQLFRYFTATDARLAILTNGHQAWFFSDTEEPNKMDRRPFFSFDFQHHDKEHIRELARFQKGSFDIDAIIEAASNLKYTRDAAMVLKRQLERPDDDFIRLIGRRIHDGPMTRNALEQIKPAIRAALDQIIRDRIQDKLGIAFQDRKAPEPEDGDEQPLDDGIVTTDEEWEGFRIVRAIGARIVPIERITIRDAKSYCAIIMDDNNRKPICRLYFNSPTTKNIVLFDAQKNEKRLRVSGPEDLYTHYAALEAVIQSYAE